MIGDLKPYAAFMDAGRDWLGSIPAHWGLLRAKRLFRGADERSKTGKEERRSVLHLTRVTPRRLKIVAVEATSQIPQTPSAKSSGHVGAAELMCADALAVNFHRRSLTGDLGANTTR